MRFLHGLLPAAGMEWVVMACDMKIVQNGKKN